MQDSAASSGTVSTCCFALFVCLTLLAPFFLSSHLSFKNMYIMHTYMSNQHDKQLQFVLLNINNILYIQKKVICTGIQVYI